MEVSGRSIDVGMVALVEICSKSTVLHLLLNLRAYPFLLQSNLSSFPIKFVNAPLMLILALNRDKDCQTVGQLSTFLAFNELRPYSNHQE